MNNNTYKYWFFYIKPEYLNLVNTEEEDSLLYAYTDNKEYSKLFKDQRDMTKFFIVKREINKEEVNYLASNFMREYLILKTVKTKTKGMGSKIIDYDLILTKTEEFMIQSKVSKILMADLWSYSWSINPYIFTNEYIEALDNVGFNERFNTLHNTNIPNSEKLNISNNIQPDLLSAFIKEYGFLLSRKEE